MQLFPVRLLQQHLPLHPDMLKSSAASKKFHATGKNAHHSRGSQGLTHSAPPGESRKKKDKVVYYLGLTKYSIVSKVCASLPNWVQCFDENDDWDLCWTDSAVSPERFSRMRPYQKINHFVGTSAISRKNYLARNMLRMKAYYPNEYKFFPHTWSLPAGKSCNTSMKTLTLRLLHTENSAVYSQDTTDAWVRTEQVPTMSDDCHCLVQQSVFSSNILSRVTSRTRDPPLRKLPTGSSVTDACLLTDLPVFRSQFTGKRRKTFIIKPDASSQGRGIFLTRNIEDINSSDHLVAQRYIHKPFLIDGLKFDLRVYVLLSGCNPLRIFVHQDGLVRFATKAYAKPTTKNLGDKTMHLTNYAINKSSSNFEQNCDPGNPSLGHKRSMFHVLDRLRQEGHDVDSLCTTIDECLCKTIIGIQPSLAHIYGSCKGEDLSNSMCFEVLGIDIMIDHKLTPWLIEVNHSPSFTTDSELDSLVKFRVIRDALVLLDLSPDARRKYHTQQRILAEQRRFAYYNQQTRDDRLHDRQQIVAELARRRTAWEDAHLGGWRRIYPTEERSRRYSHLLEAAQEIWQCVTGMCKTKTVLARILEERKEASQKSESTAATCDKDENDRDTTAQSAICSLNSSNANSKTQPPTAEAKIGVDRRRMSTSATLHRFGRKPSQARRTSSTMSTSSASSSSSASTMCSTSLDSQREIVNNIKSPKGALENHGCSLGSSGASRKGSEASKGKEKATASSVANSTEDTSLGGALKQGIRREKCAVHQGDIQNTTKEFAVGLSQVPRQRTVRCSRRASYTTIGRCGASGEITAKEADAHESNSSSGLEAEESCGASSFTESYGSRNGDNMVCTRAKTLGRRTNSCSTEKLRRWRLSEGSFYVEQRFSPKQVTSTAVHSEEGQAPRLKIVDMGSMCRLPVEEARRRNNTHAEQPKKRKSHLFVSSAANVALLK